MRPDDSWIEAGASVRDLDVHSFLVSPHVHPGLRCPCVLGHIDQQFPDRLEEEHRLLFGNLNVLRTDVDQHAQLTLGHVFTQPLERGSQPELSQDWRT